MFGRIAGLIVGLLFLSLCSALMLTMAQKSGSGYARVEYAAPNGDCFVPPQGDPLWDAHYAENVNTPNCQAYLDQSLAHINDATATATTNENIINLAGAAFVVLIVLFVLGFIVYGLTQNPS